MSSDFLSTLYCTGKKNQSWFVGLRGCSQWRQTWMRVPRTTATVPLWFIAFAPNKEEFTEKVLFTWMHCTKTTKSNETHTVTPQRCRSAFSPCAARWVISTEKHTLTATANLSSSSTFSTSQHLIFFTYGWCLVTYIIAAPIHTRPQMQTWPGESSIFCRGEMIKGPSSPSCRLIIYVLHPVWFRNAFWII